MKKRRLSLLLGAITGLAFTLGFGVACGNDGGQDKSDGASEHTCSYVLENAEEKYLKSPATCTEKAVYYKSCSCGKASETETFEYGKALDHDYTTFENNGDGSHTKTCSRDGSHTATETCHGGTASCTEKAKCEDCGSEYGELAQHSYTNEKAEDKYLKDAATCAKKAVYYKSCPCGKASETETFEYGEFSSKHTYEGGFCKDCGKAYESDGLLFALNDDGNSYKVTGIGDCTDTDLFIPETYNNLPVTSIGANAFNGCVSLESVVIPDGVTSIGDQAFRSCESLESVAIPDSVTSIGELAFEGCYILKSVTISDKLTEIGYGLFENCKSLESVVIPDGVTSIGETAFYRCGSLKSVVIGSDVESIGDFAFEYCTSLENVVIPDKVTEIGHSAFEDCTSLTSVTLGAKVRKFGNFTFLGCYRLAEVCCLSSSLGVVKGDWKNGYVAYYAIGVYRSKNEPSKIATTNDGYIFFEDGETVCLIGYKGTETKLILPAQYNGKNYTINQYAFYDYDALTSVVIPDSMASIGTNAFEDCDLLESVTIGSGVTSVGTYAFNKCNKLASITVVEGNSVYCSIDGVLFNKEKTTLIGYPGGKDVTSYTIPDGVTSIGYGAFRSCNLIENVIIPDSVTSIGVAAFTNCLKLESVVIPDSVTSIGEAAFYGCKSLKSITIPDGMTSIEAEMFNGCSLLKSVVIPVSVKSIGDNAFYNCGSIRNIYYKGDSAGWSSVNISEKYNGHAYLKNNATVYYYSADKQTYGNYWHYDEDGITPVIWTKDE